MNLINVTVAVLVMNNFLERWYLNMWFIILERGWVLAAQGGDFKLPSLFY